MYNVWIASEGWQTLGVLFCFHRANCVNYRHNSVVIRIRNIFLLLLLLLLFKPLENTKDVSKVIVKKDKTESNINPGSEPKRNFSATKLN